MIVAYNLDLLQNELLNAAIQKLATAPTSPVQGQVYFNTSTKFIMCWDGTTWLNLGGTLQSVAAASGSALTVTISNGVATIDIGAASASQKGTMSAADYSKLAASTSNNTASTLVQRDASGNITVNNVAASGGSVGTNAVNPTDIVNLQTLLSYLTSGTKYKGVVKVATTANITLSGVQTIDTVSCVAGDKVLVFNQTTGSENGIWVVAAGAWVRDASLAAGASAAGSHIIVDQGATHADSAFICTTNAGSDTVGTNALAFNKQPNSIQVDNVTIEFASGALRLKDGAVTGAKIAPSVFGTGLTFTGGVLSVTGYTPLSGTTVSRKAIVTGSIGSGTATTFTHNLNSDSVSVEIFNATTNEKVYAKVVAASVNTTAITANGTNFNVRVVCQG